MGTPMPATSATKSDIDRLAVHYTFRDPEAVAAFVRDHPEVVPPLLEAAEVVPRYFGPGTSLVLEVERDRDARDHRELFALIQTSLDADAAMACQRRFEDEWWLDVLPTANRKLTFGLEYR
jgi:hypothetical protein